MTKMSQMAVPTAAMTPPGIPAGLLKILEEYCPRIPCDAPVQVPTSDVLDLSKFPGVGLHSIVYIIRGCCMGTEVLLNCSTRNVLPSIPI